MLQSSGKNGSLPPHWSVRATGALRSTENFSLFEILIMLLACRMCTRPARLTPPAAPTRAPAPLSRLRARPEEAHAHPAPPAPCQTQRSPPPTSLHRLGRPAPPYREPRRRPLQF